MLTNFGIWHVDSNHRMIKELFYECFDFKVKHKPAANTVYYLTTGGYIIWIKSCLKMKNQEIFKYR